MYHRKYCDVQTLLNETKAKVCASMVEGREDLERNGMMSDERRSCGMNAKVVRRDIVEEAEER